MGQKGEVVGELVKNLATASVGVDMPAWKKVVARLICLLIMAWPLGVTLEIAINHYMYHNMYLAITYGGILLLISAAMLHIAFRGVP